jgi:hypothetical protein
MDSKGSQDDFFRLGDIGDYKVTDDILPIGSATIIAINFAAMLTRMGIIGGNSLNTFFDTFGLEGILANTSLIVIMFQIARWGYTKAYTETGHSWSPFVFVCALLVVQLLHDVFFYYGAINAIPIGNNEMIDALKKYSKEHGSRALAGHAAFLIFVAVLAMFFKERTFLFTFIAVNLTLYILPFVITTFGPKPPPPPVVEKKQVSPGWNGPRY